jgi:hypothetical protein
MIVIVLPRIQHRADLGQRGEQRLVQQLVAQAGVEALDEGVLGRLAGGDVVPRDLDVLAPAQHRHAGQLGPVGLDQRQRHRTTISTLNVAHEKGRIVADAALSI